MVCIKLDDDDDDGDDGRRCRPRVEERKKEDAGWCVDFMGNIARTSSHVAESLKTKRLFQLFQQAVAISWNSIVNPRVLDATEAPLFIVRKILKEISDRPLIFTFLSSYAPFSTRRRARLEYTTSSRYEDHSAQKFSFMNSEEQKLRLHRVYAHGH